MGQGPVEIGHLKPEVKKNVNVIVDILQKSELNGVLSDHLYKSIWKKICVNGTANALCTILECNLAMLNDSTYAQNLIYKITQEIVHVTTSDYVHLNVDEVFDYLINDNRKTGIDYINGAVSQLGKENKISTPVNEFVTNLIHSKESQRQAQ